jgi:hypothetical protein
MMLLNLKKLLSQLGFKCYITAVSAVASQFCQVLATKVSDNIVGLDLFLGTVNRFLYDE